MNKSHIVITYIVKYKIPKYAQLTNIPRNNTYTLFTFKNLDEVKRI